MSCRVVGRGVEVATLSSIIAHIGHIGDVSADLIETSANDPCRDLFARLGFERIGTQWILTAALKPPNFSGPVRQILALTKLLLFSSSIVSAADIVKQLDVSYGEGIRKLDILSPHRRRSARL